MVPGGGGICMGRMDMGGGGSMEVWEPSGLEAEPFCRWTMLGGALRTLALSGGGKRERGGAMGRRGPDRGGGGGIPTERRGNQELEKTMSHKKRAREQIKRDK